MRVLILALFLPLLQPMAARAFPTGNGHLVTLEGPQPPSFGPSDAPVVMEVVLQPGLGYSLRTVGVARRVQARTGDVRLIILPTSIGQAGWDPTIELLWEASAEGPEQLGQVLDRLERTMGRSPYGPFGMGSPGPPSPAELVRLATDAGLDGERLEAALADHRHLQSAERVAQAVAQGARGGGDLRVNGRRVPVGTDETTVGNAVREGRERAFRLRDLGVPASRLQAELARDEGTTRRSTLPRTPPARTTISIGDAPTRGPRLAKVTVAVFCGMGIMTSRSCAEMLTLVKRVLARQPTVQLVWKTWSQMSSPQSDIQVTELVAAAAVEGRLWELVDAWMALPSPRPTTRAGLDPLARAVGIQPPTVRSTFGPRLRETPMEQAAQALLVRDRADAQTLGLMWRPGIWVGSTGSATGTLLNDAPQEADLEERIVAELELGFLQKTPALSSARK